MAWDFLHSLGGANDFTFQVSFSFVHEHVLLIIMLSGLPNALEVSGVKPLLGYLPLLCFNQLNC